MVKGKGSFNQEKLRLRMVYKQYKVGLLKWEEIDPLDQALLEKYYGVGEE